MLARFLALLKMVWPAAYVEPEVEESKLTHTTFDLQAYPEGPDVLELEGCLLPDDLALVPRFAMNTVGSCFHDGLPSS